MTPRCILFFPGTRPDMYAKAIASGADQVCMDLEDAVAPGAKQEARASAMSVLQAPDFDPERFILRINNPATPEGDRDLAALGELAVDVEQHVVNVGLDRQSFDQRPPGRFDAAGRQNADDRGLRISSGGGRLAREGSGRE